MSNYFSFIRLPKIKKFDNTVFAWVEGNKYSHILFGVSLQRETQKYQNYKGIHSLYQLFHLYKLKRKIRYKRGYSIEYCLYSQKIGNKCLSARGWFYKLWHTHTMEYHQVLCTNMENTLLAILLQRLEKRCRIVC